ncbi:AsmA family protein, partial [Sphingomonas bacterium]|uniref:AsmA family protein n=1 Tax=Sphingomonas bacterium TaxID=1895847 RepID=UPI0015758A4C
MSPRRERPVHDAVAIPVAVLATLIGLIVLAWATLYVTKGRFLKPTFERLAGSALGRTVTVRGDFQIYFDPFDLHFLAQGFAISNPGYASRPALFRADRVEAMIRPLSLAFGRRRFRWMDVANGVADLEWSPDHKSNTWTFGSPKTNGRPFVFPVIDRARVAGTTVRYRDGRLPLLADLGIQTIASADAHIDGAVRFTATGRVRTTPFTATGALLSPNATVGRGRNELRLDADAAHNHLTVHGTLPSLAEFDGVPLAVAARGRNMAELFRIIGVVLPPTRTYRLRATLVNTGTTYAFSRLAGRFGDSDLSGTLTVEAFEPRIHLDATLATHRLDIVDAAPFIGYDPDLVATQGAAAASGQGQATPRLLPDTALPVDEFGNFDADLKWRIAVVRSRRVPLSDIGLTLKLDDRLLTLKPLDFTMSRGTVASSWTIDARRRPAHWTADIRLAPTPMGRLLAGWGVSEAGTSGVVKGHIGLVGDGNSFHDWLSTSRGRIAFILPRGSFWTRNVQLAELDLGVFAQKMFTRELKEPVQINCGLIAFSVRRGIAAADPILIDTTKNVMLGRGGFSFRNESLDLAFRADAKKFSLFSGQSPVGIEGFFARPRLDVLSRELAGRAGAAVALGLLATPPAAILAFVDVGDAKAAACGP